MFGGAALSWPVGAAAQAQRVSVIGVLGTTSFATP
jgi:hypothetical protein